MDQLFSSIFPSATYFLNKINDTIYYISIEEIGLANAIREGRQDEFIEEEAIFSLLDGQDEWRLSLNQGLLRTWKRSNYRIRLGDYRIGIEIQKDTIIFTRFLHRKDIYKFFP